MKTRVIKGWRLYSVEENKEQQRIRPKSPEYDFESLDQVIKQWATPNEQIRVPQASTRRV